MIAVNDKYLQNIENLKYIRENNLSIVAPCDKCGLYMLVDRTKDKINEILNECKGMNFHAGVAQYLCTCGKPFELFVD